jgi:hypothetical protein
MQYTAVWASWGHGFAGDIMAHWADVEHEGIDRNGIVEGIDDPRWSWLVPDAAAKQKYANRGVPANRIYTLNALPNATYTANRQWHYVQKHPLQHVRLASFFSCESASDTGVDLPGTAFAMGAKSAIGITNVVQPTNLSSFSENFFHQLRQGIYLDTAAAQANANGIYLSLGIDYKISGEEKTVLTWGAEIQLPTTVYKDPRWGDGKGPEAGP